MFSFCGSKISGFPGPQISQIWPGPGRAWTLGVGLRCWLLIFVRMTDVIVGRPLESQSRRFPFGGQTFG